MRSVIALIVIIYLIGVGVALSPTIQAKWSSASAADLTASVAQELPSAFAWPARAYHGITATEGSDAKPVEKPATTDATPTK
jgi:hypothetical protein